METSIMKENFGTMPDGKKADLYTLTNSNGLIAKITNYGCIVTELHVPDRNGKIDDVVLGYDSLDDYIKETPYFGAVVGRYGNRIAKGKFTLNGQEYTLAVNNDKNHLHGGIVGFDKVLWHAEAMHSDDGPALKLSYISPDGEEGYPGNLSCTVIYTLTNNDELMISYEARTDKATPINLTQHSYFNLEGHNAGDILDHEIMINADHFTPVDSTLIPTGELKPVKDTPMDFKTSTAIGARIDQDDQQLEFGGGYDHNWVLNNKNGDFALACSVYEPKTGRVMDTYTTEPGMQFYAGNFLDGSNVGKNDAVYNHRNGFCLETQHFPDSPNQPDFPSVILEPGKKYQQLTAYRFSVK
jgi:aldose 1-epimerase